VPQLPPEDGGLFVAPTMGDPMTGFRKPKQDPPLPWRRPIHGDPLDSVDRRLVALEPQRATTPALSSPWNASDAMGKHVHLPVMAFLPESHEEPPIYVAAIAHAYCRVLATAMACAATI
jgi:hypothetical protein